MKKYLSLLLMVLMTIMSCQKFDDSEIWDKLNDHEARIAYLEEVCKNMNTSIVNLQAVVTALETNDYIVSASPLVTGDGYTIIFKSGKSIVIYNGKDGADGIDGEDGKDGADGKDGQDGVTPVISVRQDTDGYYYWTVDGEWLIVNGEKVKAAATDGKDGEDGENGENGTNGADGVTPKFKIEEDYWYVSYDNGQTWEKLGKATSNNGLNGVDGDTLFNRVYIEDGYVCFELNDDTQTIIRIPLMKDGALTITLEKEGTLLKAMTDEQIRTTTSLVIEGRVNVNDMRYIQILNSLQKLDLSKVVFVNDEYQYEIFELNPYKETLMNRTISEITLPKFSKITTIDFSYCLALRKIVATNENAMFEEPVSSPCLIEVEYAEGVTKPYKNGWASDFEQIDRITYPSTMKYIPLGLMAYTRDELVVNKASSSKQYNYYNATIATNILVCKAITPPVIEEKYTYDADEKRYWSESSHSSPKTYYYYKVIVPTDAILYVPSESVEAYRNAPIWDNFTNILPLESLEN